jgi:mono/diheme cytochrome c family protein
MRRPELIVLLFLLLVPGAHAQDARRGRQLYETHCISCHYEHVHERAQTNTRVHSLDDLRAQVRDWGKLTGQTFTQDDLDDIAAYLNESHYHLEK